MAERDYVLEELCMAEAGRRQLFSGAYYSVLFVARGACALCWDGQRHLCGTEDVFLMKPGKAAWLEYAGGKYPLQAFWMRYSPALLRALSDEKTDLEASFNVVPFECISVRAESTIVMLAKNLFRRLCELKREQGEFAAALFEESLLKMLVVLVLRACIHAEFRQRQGSRRSFMLDEVFLYIRTHLAEELSLEQLEQEFYVSKYHIAREFKRATGQTVHRYVTKAKLDACLAYIEQGFPITEVYRMGGFGGYNHFFRAFKKEYGMTPKAYFRRTREK